MSDDTAHVNDGKLCFVRISDRKDPIAPVKVYDLLREHGYDPSWGDRDPHYGVHITFPVSNAFTSGDLDFLRPQYLPPL